MSHPALISRSQSGRIPITECTLGTENALSLGTKRPVRRDMPIAEFSSRGVRTIPFSRLCNADCVRRPKRAITPRRIQSSAEVETGIYRAAPRKRTKAMLRTPMIAAVSAAVLTFSPIAFAQQTGGTAAEAKAMLMKAVARREGA